MCKFIIKTFYCINWLKYDIIDGDLNQLITNLVIYFTKKFEFNSHILFWAFIYYNIKTFLRNKKMKIQS